MAGSSVEQYSVKNSEGQTLYPITKKEALYPVIEHDSKNHAPTLDIEPF